MRICIEINLRDELLPEEYAMLAANALLAGRTVEQHWKRIVMGPPPVLPQGAGGELQADAGAPLGLADPATAAAAAAAAASAAAAAESASAAAAAAALAAAAAQVLSPEKEETAE